ncbi:hypothetical protein [Streptomyces similanensis]|uniref:DUF3995 domain-containing protein n=1 Tax=Streptomyces similanensis TaxID=1274988 RepID=A0ABP9L3I7_9ACTN|nr:hypothetical protein HUT11_33590 [Streptomyces seoulensis]
MKKVLEVVGFLALTQGVLGVVHGFTHWRAGLVWRVSFLDGYEIWASVGLLLLALVLFAVADRVRSDRAKSEE